MNRRKMQIEKGDEKRKQGVQRIRKERKKHVAV